MPKEISEETPKPRIPLNIKRPYYTMGLVHKGATYTFFTKYGYVFPAAEFEAEGRYSYTLACKINDKLEKEIEQIEKSCMKLDFLEDFEFKSPVKERNVADEPVRFINVKLKRDVKNENKWMFSGDLPEEDDDCILKLLPRVYVNREAMQVGVYFELKAVEK